MDELVNWESSQTGDGERFSQDINRTTGKRNSGMTSFENYLKKKEIRMAAKQAAAKNVANELQSIQSIPL